MNGNDRNPSLGVCLGPECSQCGGPELFRQLRALGAEVQRLPCQGLCHEAPVVKRGGRYLDAQSFDELVKALIATQPARRLPSAPESDV
ncbi:MAG: (2Fe-2S) ferredoxin domain-containing protein [Zetaproteobacteria bacterium]|nr:MAG: (2Fe-2S) ferredoxin domain-containing protein [Zetaproteobacteria bacterium]